MLVERKNFPSVLKDNDSLYFNYVQAAIESVDFDSHLLITQKCQAINFRIAPSTGEYTNTLIEQLNKLHNSLGIKVVFAKSIKTSFNISFDVNF